MTKEQIKDAIKDMTDHDIMELNNVFCELENYVDNHIYINDEDFFNTFFQERIDIARAISYGDYRFSDEYVRFDGYGNLESIIFLDLNDLADSVENVATCVEENFKYFKHLFNG
jgi:hypothetical protein